MTLNDVVTRRPRKPAPSRFSHPFQRVGYHTHDVVGRLDRLEGEHSSLKKVVVLTLVAAAERAAIGYTLKSLLFISLFTQHKNHRR